VNTEEDDDMVFGNSRKDRRKLLESFEMELNGKHGGGSNNTEGEGCGEETQFLEVDNGTIYMCEINKQ